MFQSASDNEKSQSKMVTDDDEEENVSDHENVKTMSIGDEKGGSESDDQSVWSFLLFWSYVLLVHAWLVCQNLWLKKGSRYGSMIVCFWYSDGVTDVATSFCLSVSLWSFS